MRAACILGVAVAVGATLGSSSSWVSSASAGLVVDCRSDAGVRLADSAGNPKYFALPVTGPGALEFSMWVVITDVNNQPVSGGRVLSCIGSLRSPGDAVLGDLTFSPAEEGWLLYQRGNRQDVDDDQDIDIGPRLDASPPKAKEYFGLAADLAAPVDVPADPGGDPWLGGAAFGTLTFAWTGWGDGDPHGVTTVRFIGKPGIGPAVGCVYFPAGETESKFEVPQTREEILLYRPAVARVGDGSPVVATPHLGVLLDAGASEGSLNTYEWDLNGDGTPDATGPTVALAWQDLLDLGLEMGQSYDARLVASYRLNPTITSDETAFTLTLVPEPATLALVALAGLGLLCRKPR